MKRLTWTASVGVAVISGAMAFAGSAVAQPPPVDDDTLPENAQQAVDQLQSQGYQVEVLGGNGSPLVFCEVEEATQKNDPPTAVTVFVDCVPD